HRVRPPQLAGNTHRRDGPRTPHRIQRSRPAGEDARPRRSVSAVAVAAAP
ncbi:RHS Repeat family protein, partial [Escherichia coli 96.0427]